MKKILFLVLFLNNFILAETYIMSNYCCYSLDTHGDNIVWDNTIVGSGRYSTNQSVWESELNSQGYNTAPLCVGRGVMENYSLINGTDTIDNGDNTYTQVFDIQKTHKEYECTCSSPDTNKTDLNTTLFSVIYDGEASEAPSECYEPIEPIYNELYQIDCVVMMQCWTPVKPPFDCTQKGEGWVYNSDDTAEGCSSWVGNGDIDGASFEEGSTISPTCCLHYESDDNDTTPPDDNDTTPPDDAQAIIDAITEQSTQEHTDAQAIIDAITEHKDTNHADSEAIKGSIDEFAETNHADLQGIKEGTDVLKEWQTEGDQAKSDKESMVNTLNETLEDMQGSYDSITGTIATLSTVSANAPHFVGSTNSVVSGTVMGTTLNLDFHLVASLRQYIDIIWVLLLAFFNFRIYLWILKFLIKIGV